MIQVNTDLESGGEDESSDDYSEEESDWEGEEDDSGKYRWGELRALMITLRKRVAGRVKNMIQVNTDMERGQDESSNDYFEEESDWEG